MSTRSQSQHMDSERKQYVGAMALYFGAPAIAIEIFKSTNSTNVGFGVEGGF
jgi:hypothetical protein